MPYRNPLLIPAYILIGIAGMGIGNYLAVELINYAKDIVKEIKEAKAKRINRDYFY
jgi:uncharacterized membrane protein SpoIIM required for sporulation